jgi:hypothetical protein
MQSLMSLDGEIIRYISDKVYLNILEHYNRSAGLNLRL